VSARTRIEWTDATWNPIRGCTRVSEGCRNCYAERVAARFSGYGQPYAGLAVMTSAGPRWTGSVVAIEEHLDDPMRWRKPRRVFVNSMSDLFHDDVPDDLLDLLFSTMSVCNIHTFQVLTKRPQRMCDYLRAPERAKRIENSSYGLPTGWPIPNVWIGVSVENQPTADERIPLLFETPATVRFLSIEPMIEPTSLRWLCAWPENKPHTAMNPTDNTNQFDGLRRLDWIICGGESGPGARPMELDWARSLRDQCATSGTAFFMKQICDWQGKKIPFERWPEDLKVRQFPEVRP